MRKICRAQYKCKGGKLSCNLEFHVLGDDGLVPRTLSYNSTEFSSFACLVYIVHSCMTDYVHTSACTKSHDFLSDESPGLTISLKSLSPGKQVQNPMFYSVVCLHINGGLTEVIFLCKFYANNT